jgi:hypothetical protein
MSILAGLLTGDPLRGAIGGCDLTIECHSQFEGDEWQPCAPVMEVTLICRNDLILQDTTDHLDTGGLELGDSHATDPVVGIGRPDYDP